MSDERETPPGAPGAGAGGEAEPAPTPAAPATPEGSAAAPPAPAPTPAAPAAPAAPRAPLSPEEKAAVIAKAKAAAAAKAAAPGAGAAGAAPAAPRPAAPATPAAHADADKHPWEVDPKSPEWTDAGDDPLAGALKEEFGDAIESARKFAGDLTFAIRRDAVGEVAAALKAKHRFTYLIDVCGADYPKRAPRFDVVYHLHRFDDQRRVRLKVATDEETPVPTVSHVWKAANWPEREVYDMYGVRFAGHPDMTRILLWEGFNGYPLRKDFPVEGIDTGSAIYPEYYEEKAGPVSGTGTGWRPAGSASAKPAVAAKPAAPAAAAKAAAPAPTPPADGEPPAGS